MSTRKIIGRNGHLPVFLPVSVPVFDFVDVCRRNRDVAVVNRRVSRLAVLCHYDPRSWKAIRSDRSQPNDKRADRASARLANPGLR